MLDPTPIWLHVTRWWEIQRVATSDCCAIFPTSSWLFRYWKDLVSFTYNYVLFWKSSPTLFENCFVNRRLPQHVWIPWGGSSSISPNNICFPSVIVVTWQLPWDKIGLSWIPIWESETYCIFASYTGRYYSNIPSWPHTVFFHIDIP